MHFRNLYVFFYLMSYFFVKLINILMSFNIDLNNNKTKIEIMK